MFRDNYTCVTDVCRSHIHVTEAAALSDLFLCAVYEFFYLLTRICNVRVQSVLTQHSAAVRKRCQQTHVSDSVQAAVQHNSHALHIHTHTHHLYAVTVCNLTQHHSAKQISQQ